MRLSPCRRGFTLVELLVTMAIIAVLAGLVFAVLTGAQRQADRAVAVTNLKSVGAAIAGYVGEHDGDLPGPIFPGQVASYWSDKPERLTVILASYLDIDPNTDKSVFLEVFAPPAFMKSDAARHGANDARTLVANQKVLKGAELVSPFGSAVPGAENGVMKLVQVPDPGENWALSDADQQHPHVNAATWKSFTASRPYHGDKRVALFFDWHVEARAKETFEIPVPTPETP